MQKLLQTHNYRNNSNKIMPETEIICKKIIKLFHLSCPVYLQTVMQKVQVQDTGDAQ